MSRTIYLFSITLTLAMLCVIQKVHAQSLMASSYLRFDGARQNVIIFVHGVTGDARDTWTNATTGTYWPDLIRSDPQFSSANVWVFSFYSPKTGIAQNVEEIARKLGNELNAQGVIQGHEKIYFLTHSMGGLIVRDMLTQLQLPAAKIPMIYFYGAPSAGADLAGLAAAVSSNPQFNNLRPFARESDVAAYSRRWLSTAENPTTRYPQRIWSFCAYEVEGMVGGKVIVPQHSASFLCTTSPRASLANHSTMVKPENRTAESYTYFLHAFRFSQSEAGRILAATGNLRLHTASYPGINAERLELRTAPIPASYFNIRCDESRDGVLFVPLVPKLNEKVIGAQASVSMANNVALSLIQTQIANEGARVEFIVAGPKRQGANCQNGSASVFLKYVVEPRQ